MSATTIDTDTAATAAPVLADPAVDPALLKPFPPNKRPVYFDPSASGARGPNLRIPGTREFLRFAHAAIEPECPRDEEVVRAYLGRNADAYRGADLDQPMICSCGAIYRNMRAASEHKQRFPDRGHELRF